MLRTTSTNALTPDVFTPNAEKHDFLVQVPADSPAGILVKSGAAIIINNVRVEDTGGLTVAPLGSIRLSGSQPHWMIGTALNGTAATFEIISSVADRRHK